MKSAIFLKKYYTINFSNISSSQFIYETNKHLVSSPEFKCLISFDKLDGTHYLYLFLLTQQVPRLVKYKQSSIKSRNENISNLNKKSLILYVFLKSYNIWKVMSILFLYIFSQQATIEKDIFHVNNKTLRLVIENMPLFNCTKKLQSSNHYITPIPFSLIFQSKNSSLFEKLYFVKTFKILQLSSYIKGLSNYKLI
jgi:hypothetical protein